MAQAITIDTVEILNLANQLRCPEGKAGKDLGYLMSTTNKGMIKASINELKLKPQNRVLEIGHASCVHLKDILKQKKGLRYFGLEISQTMVNEANQNNRGYVNDRKALFQEYDGYKIPYVHNFFDRIMTVNTIYFWENPKEFLIELHRVLKPKGLCVITFANADFMKKLPFVNDVFQLYDVEKMKKLGMQTLFEPASFYKKREQVKSKSGEMVNRSFTVAVLKKSPKVKEERTRVFDFDKQYD